VTTLLWVLAIAMIAVGVAGTVLPALPGVLLVAAGIVLAAWIDDFARIGTWSLVAVAVLAVIGVVTDLLAGLLFARRAGASRLGLLGAAIGTVAGVFAGLIGVLFLPLVGAFVGEVLAQREPLHAGKIGLATWLGLLFATAVKLAVVFAMIGVLVVALLL
jgi:uncharacterized protein